MRPSYCSSTSDAAARAEIALDVQAVLRHRPPCGELVREEVQRLLVHRAAGDGVDGASSSAGVLFEAALEHRDDRRLAAADRAHQQQDALAHLEPPGRRREVVDQMLQRALDAEQLVREEVVAGVSPTGASRRPGPSACRRRARARGCAMRGFCQDEVEVLLEGALARRAAAPRRETLPARESARCPTSTALQSLAHSHQG